VAKVDPQTIELHFALGSLFRRRGEVERAISMHQNLAERPDLDPQEQKTAGRCYELAQDYLKAGLLDRAEELLQATGRHAACREQALRFLLDIYEQEKEWDKAIVDGRAAGGAQRQFLPEGNRQLLL
jgi:lipopolysaccharide assembly protein B